MLKDEQYLPDGTTRSDLAGVLVVSGAIISAAGLGLSAVGCALDWFSNVPGGEFIEGDFIEGGYSEPAPINGFDAGGVTILILALAALVVLAAFLLKPHGNRWLLGVAFVLAVSVIAYPSSYFTMDYISFEVGLWLIFGGGSIGIAGICLAFAAGEIAERGDRMPAIVDTDASELPEAEQPIY